MKFIIKLLRHPIFKIIIPFLLLVFWLIATLYLIIKSDISMSVLSKTYDKDIFNQELLKPLEKGDVLRGEFTAKENNLGMILVRFDTRSKSINDTIIFRLEKKGDMKWYADSLYNTDQIVHDSLFPFGIKKIPNSKGKTYIFEIESLHGKGTEAMLLSTVEPIFVTKYQFEKTQLKSDWKNMAYFLVQKSIATLEDRSNLYISLSFLIPLILYSISLTFLKYFSHYKILNIRHPDLAALNQLSVLIYIVLLTSYIFLIKQNIYPISITFLILWLIFIKKYNISYRTTLFFACILYLISIIIPQTFSYYENIIMWGNIYLFLSFSLFLFQVLSNEK